MLQIDPHGGPSPLDASRDRARRAAQALEAAGEDHRVHVLMVEPEPFLVRQVRRALSRTGCRIEAAEAWDAALERLNGDGPVDLLLVDLDVRNGSTPPRLDQALAARPSLRILLLASHGAEGLDAPGHPILRKPFDTTGLLEKVARALNGPDG